MKRGLTESSVRVHIFATDAPRGAAGRRDLYLERRSFPDDMPWVKVPAGQINAGETAVPALVGLRGELRSTRRDPDGKIVEASWVITPWPWTAEIVRKFGDRTQRDSMLRPALEALSALNPQDHAWFDIHVGLAAKTSILGMRPFFEASFGSYHAERQRAANMRAMARWLGIPAIVNLFGGLVGAPPWYPAGYVAFDSWNTDSTFGTIDALLRDRPAQYAESLWKAWLLEDFYKRQLLDQAVLGVEQAVVTRFERDAGLRTIFARGFDRGTLYFAESKPVRRSGRVVPIR